MNNRRVLMERSLERSAQLSLEVLERAQRRSVRWPARGPSEGPKVHAAKLRATRDTCEHYKKVDDAFDTILNLMANASKQCKTYYRSVPECYYNKYEANHLCRYHSENCGPASSKSDVFLKKARSLCEERADLGTSADPNVMWETFHDKTLKVPEGCVGVMGAHRRRCFISQGTLDIIERSRSTRLNGNSGLYREQRRTATRSLRADKEVFHRGICEQVTHHLWSSDPCPAYRGIEALRTSESVPWRVAVRVADGTVLTGDTAVVTRWAGYFEQLFKADLPGKTLDISVCSDYTPWSINENQVKSNLGAYTGTMCCCTTYTTKQLCILVDPLSAAARCYVDDPWPGPAPRVPNNEDLMSRITLGETRHMAVVP
ncbi:AKIP1 protein, partial [Polypterus senegalus]